jgi:hypothetical protein
MKSIAMSLLLLVAATNVQAQQSDPDQWLIWILDRFGDDLDEESMMDRLSTLEAFLVAPIPITNVDKSILQSIQLFTDDEIESIVDWLRETPIMSLNEEGLRSIPELDEMVAEIVIALVSFHPVVEERGRRRWQSLERGAWRGMVDYKAGQVFPIQEGYRSDGRYLGPGYTVREQFVLQNKGISARFSRYKMAGEPIEYPRKLGPWTGSVVYQGTKSGNDVAIRVRTIILGDHRFRAGLGLLASTGSMRVDGAQHRASGITSAPVTPNGASPSGKFHRGAAIQATAGNTDLAVSYSQRRLSASITDTLLYTPGWSTHIRTENDLAKHHNITLSSVSVMARRRAQISVLNVDVGATAVGFHWSDSVSRRAGFSYAEDFAGTYGFEWSMFGSAAFKNTSYAAEIGRANGKIGWIHSVQTRTSIVDVGGWARWYPFGFDSRFGNPASAYGGSNESGLGAWIRARPVARVNVNLWTDSYRSLGPRFGTRLPVAGREWGVRADWRLGAGRQVEISFRKRNRLENVTKPDDFNRMYDYRFWNEGISAKIGLHYSVSRALRYRMQVSYSQKNVAGLQFQGWGTSALVTMNLKWLTLYAQTSTFSSDGHESRAYFYEYDMLGSFRIPAFSGYGRRSYVMAHVEVWKSVVLRAKVGVTEYLDRQVIGTGVDVSVGARRWGGDVQLRWMF